MWTWIGTIGGGHPGAVRGVLKRAALWCVVQRLAGKKSCGVGAQGFMMTKSRAAIVAMIADLRGAAGKSK